MKNHRFYSLIAILLLASVTAFAGTVDVQRAKGLGEKFVEANFSKATQLEWAYTSFTEKGNPSFHVFNGTPGGFVIVSACDLTSPILGYSETGTFDMENLPDGLSYFLNGYGQSVDFAEQNLKRADFEIAREWENLEHSGQTQPTKAVGVSPLIATHWDQGCYYNACCPKDESGPCGSAYAGCVATSMAQVLKYWNYPEQGTGSYGYNCPPYGDLYVDFGSTTYHWEEMPESLSDDDINVATAMYHCGVSVNMFYGGYGSGALHQSISPALGTYFGFAPSNNLLRDNFTFNQWAAMIYGALDAAVPVLYGASSEAGSGHAFILDGYDANGLIHINWCWGGQLDGYFSIDNFHTGSQQWTMAQKMVADARPLSVYNNTPQAPANFSAQPLSDESYTCTLHWNNPSKTLSNANLTHIDQIVVKRDGSIIYTANDVTPGAAMEITDEVPFYGLFDYQVYAVNNGIHGLVATQSGVRFGPVCTWTIEAGTSSPDGWQGAAIQVINQVSQVCGSASATSSSATLHVDVPLGRVSFAWVGEDAPVYDVSFTIRDAEGQAVCSYSGLAEDLPNGVFFQTNNSCGNGTDCGQPLGLNAEVVDGSAVLLSWEPAADVSDYNIYRNGLLLRTVHDHLAEFVDNEPTHGGNCYYVASFCASGEGPAGNETCVTVGEGCQPASNLWFEITPNNNVKLTWTSPEPGNGLTKYFVYRTKESDMDWKQIKVVSPSSTSSIDNGELEDETFYLYKLVAYYNNQDCYSAPARSKYDETKYYVRVYWSVDGLEEYEKDEPVVYPNPASTYLQIEGVEAVGIRMFNALGQLVRSVENTNSVSVEGLPEGMYLLRITNKEGSSFSTKVMVKR